jgi:hemerythrin-like domain-containing protein
MAEISAFSQLLSALHQDHLDIQDVLEVVERELEHMARGEDGDFLLLADCAEYLHEYANLVHHAGEDVLFEALAAHRPELAPTVAALREEHRRLRRLADALREALACMESDTPCDRVAFLGLLREYIDIQRAHLELEERDVYPAVSAWSRERPRPLPGTAETDPFLSEETRARYRALHDHITGRIRPRGA